MRIGKGDRIPPGELLKRLGRISVKDERDKKFLMKAVVPQQSQRTYRYWWDGGWWGNQGNSPQCVAYAWIHWLEDGGVTQKSAPAPILHPPGLYEACQRNDEWVGENYDGTSVRAGAKVLKQEGFIAEYRWTWDVETLANAVLEKGPVVVGSTWYSDMFYPNSKGLITATGSDLGGHAYVINGVNKKMELFRIKNSWGREWGKNGHAYIYFQDMQRLLDENGEAALAVEIEKK